LCGKGFSAGKNVRKIDPWTQSYDRELRCRRCKNLQHWRWSCKLRVQFYDFQIYTYNTSVVVY
jgi:hypothetical protein